MFIEDLRTKLKPNTNLKNLHIKVEKAQNKNLKIIKKMKLGKKFNKIIVEPEWVDEELKTEIKKRRKLNRIWRKSQKKKLHNNIQNENETNYRIQRQITKSLTAEKKGSWEKTKIKEDQLYQQQLITFITTNLIYYINLLPSIIFIGQIISVTLCD